MPDEMAPELRLTTGAIPRGRGSLDPLTPAVPTMRAWVATTVEDPSGAQAPTPVLVPRTVVRPRPARGEIQLSVDTCAVCSLDAHLIEGTLAPRARDLIPGHAIVGRVTAQGLGATRFALGQRVGVSWLRSTCGTCRYCTRGLENLCPSAAYTGWDAHGGLAEFAVVREDFAAVLPQAYSDVEVAPLLCGGILGFRALRLASVPSGGVLSLYGFGTAASLTLQMACARGVRVHVLTRSPAARSLALSLGAVSASSRGGHPPELVDSAIVFAPSGLGIPAALEHLRPGGTLAVAGLPVGVIPALHYPRHLAGERVIRGVTGATRQDSEEFLTLAGVLPLRVLTTSYDADAAARAVRDAQLGAVQGTAVVRMSSPT